MLGSCNKIVVPIILLAQQSLFVRLITGYCLRITMFSIGGSCIISTSSPCSNLPLRLCLVIDDNGREFDVSETTLVYTTFCVRMMWALSNLHPLQGETVSAHKQPNVNFNRAMRRMLLSFLFIPAFSIVGAQVKPDHPGPWSSFNIIQAKPVVAQQARFKWILSN